MSRSSDTNRPLLRRALALAPAVLAAAAALLPTALLPTALLPIAPAQAGPRQDDDDEVARMVAHASPAVWLVEAELDSEKYGAARPVGSYRMVKLGSAFVWRHDDGWLITSASVVGDATKVTIVQPKRRIEAQVFAVDAETDIALLKVGTGQLQRFLPLATGQAKVGWHAYVLGPEMVPLRFSDGRVNHTDFRLAGYRDPLMVVNTAVDVTASGSPVLGSDGKVMGMVYGTGLGARAVGRFWVRDSNLLQAQGMIARAEPVDRTAPNNRQFVYVIPLDGKLQIQVDGNNAPQVIQVGPAGVRIAVELVCRDTENRDFKAPAPSPKEAPKETAKWSDLAFGKAPTLAMGAAQGPPTYAVPADILASVADDLRNHKRVPRGQMGIAVRDSENPPGAQIHWLLAGGPAAKAGLGKGDVIIAVGDKPVGDAGEYIRLLRARREDESLPVTVHTAAGQSRMVSVRLSAVVVEAVPTPAAQPNRNVGPDPQPAPNPPRPQGGGIRVKSGSKE